MKSGPTLKACTASPRRWSASNRPSVTVVFPTPLETPAMTTMGTISDARSVRSGTPADLKVVVISFSGQPPRSSCNVEHAISATLRDVAVHLNYHSQGESGDVGRHRTSGKVNVNVEPVPS